MSLEAIRYCKESGVLSILDQLLLPTQSQYIDVHNTEDGWKVINNMQVRGAPAIGVVACLSLAVELHNKSFSSLDELGSFVADRMKYLVTSRPTAVNISDAETKLNTLITQWSKEQGASVTAVKQQMLSGHTARPEFMKKITWLALNHHPSILFIDTVRAFHFGNNFLVECDIVLPETMDLKSSHDIGESLQLKLERLPEVERAFVHLDYETDHSPYSEHKQV